MAFSLNLTGFNVFNYFARNADNFLIGRYLGAQDLGYYDLAYRLMLYPLQAISAVIGRVMFPLYSRMQDDLEKFRNIYLSIAWAIALVSFPMMLGLMVVAEPLVLIVFGKQWETTAAFKIEAGECKLADRIPTPPPTELAEDKPAEPAVGGVFVVPSANPRKPQPKKKK